MLARDGAPQLVEVDIFLRLRYVTLRFELLDENIGDIRACSHEPLAFGHLLRILLGRLLGRRHGHSHGRHGENRIAWRWISQQR